MNRRDWFRGCLTALSRAGRAVLLAGVALAGAPAFSQAVPALTPSVPAVYSTSVAGNATTFSGATLRASNAASFSFAPASNAAVYTQSAARYFNGTQMVDVAVGSKVTPLRAAGAIGRFAGKALPIGYALGVGVALYDLAKELGWNIEGDGGAVPVISQSTTVYRYFSDYCTATSAPGQALEAFVYSCQGPTFARTSSPVSCSLTGSYMTCTHTDTWGGSRTSYYNRVLPTTGTPVPKTAQEFNDRIAAESGWPSTSAIARTLNDAIKYGEAVELVPDAVTGPASSPGPSEHIDSPSKLIDKLNTYKYEYLGPTVQVGTETVTTETDKATGAVSTTTTTTVPVSPSSPAAEPIDIETCGLPGKPACMIDETNMPKAEDTKTTQDASIAQIDIQRSEVLTGILDGASKDTSWGVSMPSWFAKPSCAPLDFGTLPVIAVPLVFNMCPYETMVDGITSFILLVITFTVVTSMVRQTLAG